MAPDDKREDALDDNRSYRAEAASDGRDPSEQKAHETKGGETKGGETKGGETKGGETKGGETKGGDDKKTGGDKQGADAKGQNKKGDDTFKAPKPLWPWLIAGAATLVFVVIVLAIIFQPHPQVKTSDAYVTAHYAMVSPRVSGQVIQVAVADNQSVRVGQLLIALDPRDYQATLDRALGQLAQDQAQVSQSQAQVERQPALILQADAQVESAKAALALSRANTARYTNLAATGAGSVQQRQQSTTQQRQDEASVKFAGANLDATGDQLRALQANRASAMAKVQSDRAEAEQARLNLSYTRIYAPLDGMVDQKSVQVGDNVGPAAAVMVVVPLQAVYVEANYRELALRHMLPGQRVRIHVDAYDIWLDGAVQGVPAASGAAFSPIPPNNATGNFTKIVQRLPVKIVFAPNQPLVRLLRVGMSVETVVDTGLYDVVAHQSGSRGRVTAP